MTRKLLMTCLVAATFAFAGARADVVHQPVMGEIDLVISEVACPHQNGCTFCVNDETTTADNRLMLAFGELFPAFPTNGLVEGFVRPFVIIDGVRLTADLLPAGSFFRSGLVWFNSFFSVNCDERPPGVTFKIGELPEMTVSDDGTMDIDIPVSQAIEVAFKFSLCSEFIYWGAGCNVGGSAVHAWRLHIPAALSAVVVAAGDTPPIVFSQHNFVADFSQSPGGVLSVSRVLEDPPVGLSVSHLNGYWDVRSDLATGSFTAQVSLGFDASSLPPEVQPATIVVAVYNDDTNAWDALQTTVDETSGLAIATTNRWSTFVLLGSAPLPTEEATWGATKVLFSSDE